MSYALSRPSTGRRGGLFAIVLGAHIGIGLLVFAARTVVPQIAEIPLVVELLQPIQPEAPPQAKPLPVSKPRPEAPRPAIKTPAAPPLEATASTVPAPSPPVAAPQETKPVPPAAQTAEAVSQARFDADYLKNPAPPYPPLSRRMGEEGKVVLRVSVTPQGTADQIEIRTSSGSDRLDQSALKTVRTWKFIPAKRGDTTIQSWVLVPIIFKLEQ